MDAGQRQCQNAVVHRATAAIASGAVAHVITAGDMARFAGMPGSCDATAFTRISCGRNSIQLTGQGGKGALLMLSDALLPDDSIPSGLLSSRSGQAVPRSLAENPRIWHAVARRSRHRDMKVHLPALGHGVMDPAPALSATPDPRQPWLQGAVGVPSAGAAAAWCRPVVAGLLGRAALCGVPAEVKALGLHLLESASIRRNANHLSKAIAAHLHDHYRRAHPQSLLVSRSGDA